MGSQGVKARQVKRSTDPEKTLSKQWEHNHATKLKKIKRHQLQAWDGSTSWSVIHPRLAFFFALLRTKGRLISEWFYQLQIWPILGCNKSECSFVSGEVAPNSRLRGLDETFADFWWLFDHQLLVSWLCWRWTFFSSKEHFPEMWEAVGYLKILGLILIFPTRMARWAMPHFQTDACHTESLYNYIIVGHL